MLVGRMTESGYDYVDADDDATNDPFGHGTAVAGILADCTDGAPVGIYPIRVLNASGSGTVSNLVLGIREAIGKGVTVINLSLESGAIRQALDDAILDAVADGITVVVAAGNKGIDTAGVSPAHIDASGAIVLPTDALVRDIILARHAGVESGILAYMFHTALAGMIAKTCELIREESGLNTCALTGGVFQNRLLTTLVTDLLRAAGFRVLLHGMIPPNDGGIGAGQAFAAMYHLNHPNHNSSISHSPIQTQGDGLCV
jgi:subtilisin family serine protease